MENLRREEKLWEIISLHEECHGCLYTLAMCQGIHDCEGDDCPTLQRIRELEDELKRK